MCASWYQTWQSPTPCWQELITPDYKTFGFANILSYIINSEGSSRIIGILVSAHAELNLSDIVISYVGLSTATNMVYNAIVWLKFSLRTIILILKRCDEINPNTKQKFKISLPVKVIRTTTLSRPIVVDTRSIFLTLYLYYIPINKLVNTFFLFFLNL